MSVEGSELECVKSSFEKRIWKSMYSQMKWFLDLNFDIVFIHILQDARLFCVLLFCVHVLQE